MPSPGTHRQLPILTKPDPSSGPVGLQTHSSDVYSSLNVSKLSRGEATWRSEMTPLKHCSSSCKLGIILGTCKVNIPPPPSRSTEGPNSSETGTKFQNSDCFAPSLCYGIQLQLCNGLHGNSRPFKIRELPSTHSVLSKLLEKNYHQAEKQENTARKQRSSLTAPLEEVARAAGTAFLYVKLLRLIRQRNKI